MRQRGALQARLREQQARCRALATSADGAERQLGAVAKEAAEAAKEHGHGHGGQQQQQQRPAAGPARNSPGAAPNRAGGAGAAEAGSEGRQQQPQQASGAAAGAAEYERLATDARSRLKAMSQERRKLEGRQVRWWWAQQRCGYAI